MGNPSDISNRPKAVVVAGKGGMQRTGQSASSFDYELRLPAGVLINPHFWFGFSNQNQHTSIII